MQGRLGPNALNFENSQKPGSYKLASIISDGTLNPGELVVIKQYITGYGEISGIKIISYISSELFDEKLSHLESGLEKNKEGSDLIHWGGEKINFFNSGITVVPASISFGKWTSPIFDTEDGQTSILTEKGLPEAPFTYKLKLKENATPGQHYIVFYMTYFNGSEWVCLEEKVALKVNNKFEQYSSTLSVLAATALLVTILHDGIYPIIDSLHDLSKYIEQIRR